MKKTALFPGTFDPFTIGHYSLIKRALNIADEVVVAIGINSDKQNMFPIKERIKTIEKTFADEPRIKVATYDTLTVDYAKSIGADFIMRGIRNFKDFEYEKSIADANRKISGIETVFLFSEPEYEYISSSLVRELMHYNKDISHLIPRLTK